MQNKNEATNWKALLLIGLPSAGLGWFVDQLLKFNDDTFLISWGLPAIMIFLYHDYLIIDLNTDGVLKPKETDDTDKWRHKIFTLIVFIFITRLIFGLIALILGITLYDIKIDNNLFAAISFTTILVSIFGDKILFWWFKTGGLLRALDSKENFFGQNNVKMLIYLSYLILIFTTNYGLKSDLTQLWINTFATYVAFERFWKFWQDQTKKKTANA
jgi:hypothetical protein